MTGYHLSSRAELVSDSPQLTEGLRRALPREGAVSTSRFDRIAAAVDASHYLLTPAAVVTPNGLDEISALFAFANLMGEPLTLRSGGTSLSGQASAGNILVDTRTFFREISVEDGGARVRVGPGLVLRQVNARLARFGRKLGPDPASEIACTIGGVLANNSSGMACGIEHNSYRTLHSAIVVLPSGTVVDTSLSDADEQLHKAEPVIWSTLAALRAEILANPKLKAEIERQHSIKNTMGYGLNSLIDFETPAEMLAHLMVGSEGTLGFIAEATFETIPLHPCAAVTLLVFENIEAATNCLVELITTDPSAIELLDAASMRAATSDVGSQNVLPLLDIVDQCALLVEFQSASESELDAKTRKASEVLARLPLVLPPDLSTDSKTRAALWRLRKGLYASIAGARPPGTTALLEDIAVPVSKLSATCESLRGVFNKHGYTDAVIFGHAKDGNIHFLITEDFESPPSVERYRSFTEDLVDLVLSVGGTLKAEHGTGRIMAPFVRRQYGDHLYRMMWDIKRVLDPRGIMNPNAVLTEIPDLHLRDLKSTPPVEQEVDRCVECGYCEPVCPSKNLTTTPRERIVIQRAIYDADQRGDVNLVAELRRERSYKVVETCAADGMCEASCPVLINTGDLVRRLRSESISPVEAAMWSGIGAFWAPFNRMASLALSVASRTPATLITVPNRALRWLLGKDKIPLWSQDLPQGGARRSADDSLGESNVVYFASCVGTMFGPASGSQGVGQAFRSLASKAGVGLITPEAIDGLCCGTPWKSKGVHQGFDSAVDKTIGALWAASGGGSIPIVCDNSSCSEGLKVALEHVAKTDSRYGELVFVDSVDFAQQHILPRIDVTRALGSIAVHPTCSSTRAGSNANLEKLAAAVAGEVVVPADWGCCAFAGDRGMLQPELTKSATEAEAKEISGAVFDEYVSCNRTCEIAMTRATGHPYRHILEALDDVASPQRTVR